jgi:hypothetical protein
VARHHASSVAIACEAVGAALCEKQTFQPSNRLLRLAPRVVNIQKEEEEEEEEEEEDKRERERENAESRPPTSSVARKSTKAIVGVAPNTTKIEASTPTTRTLLRVSSPLRLFTVIS